MVKEEDLAEVKRRLYQRALAAMDDRATRTQCWLKHVAGEILRECFETRCLELDVDFAIANIKFTTALTYAACRRVYETKLFLDMAACPYSLTIVSECGCP